MNEKKAASVIFGTAIGDALGYGVEFMKDFPRVVDLDEGALYSDDTQMMRATLEGLLSAGTFEELHLAAEAIGKAYGDWAVSPENTRAPGMTCMSACANLRAGKHWSQAGIEGSEGCGTAMRAMAFALWFPRDIESASRWAAETALMTHRSASAQASAAAVAAGVVAGFGGFSAVQMGQRMIDAADRYERRTARLLAHAIARGLDDEMYRTQKVLSEWEGWLGHEAVAASLFCLVRYRRQGFKHMVLAAVNSPGDSDSLGAITGALAGARLGMEAIPSEWVERIEKSAELEALAFRIERQHHERIERERGLRTASV